MHKPNLKTVLNTFPVCQGLVLGCLQIADTKCTDVEEYTIVVFTPMSLVFSKLTKF